MALPTSGPISLAMLHAEFGGGYSLASYYRGGSFVPNTARNAAVPMSGFISLGSFRGASYATEGSFDYSGPGAYTFVWPRCEYLTVFLQGSGGGGGGGAAQDSQGHPFLGTDGAPGSDTYFFGAGLAVIATGGLGGQNNPGTGASDGAAGTGLYGDASTTGGGMPGGQGGQPSIWPGGNGGYGGYAVRTFYRNGPHTPPPGTITTIIVGAGGAGGMNGTGLFGYAGSGSPGRVSGIWA